MTRGSPRVVPMEDEKRAFGRRLSQGMVAKGLKPRPAVLERQFNLRYQGKPMSLHGVRRWLKGETIPAQQKVVVLAEILDLDPQELRFGRREGRPTALVREPDVRWLADLGWSDRALYQAIKSLKAPQRKVVRDLILLLAGDA